MTSMNGSCLLCLFLVLTTCVLHPVQGYSTGAGGCNGGVAAVGGSHLSTANGRPVDSNTLEVSGIEVLIQGTKLTTTSTPQFPTGVDLDISIVATQIPFLGFLIRLQTSANDASAATLTPVDESTTQVAAVCTSPVEGITHRDNLPKLSVNGTLRFDQPLNGATVDVTIVFTNGAPASIYAYTGYKVDVIGGEPTSPTSPTSPASEAPVTSPTESEAPAAGTESETPSQSPTETQEFLVPTVKPTEAPVSKPSPVKAPVSKPVGTKTSSPTVYGLSVKTPSVHSSPHKPSGHKSKPTESHTKGSKPSNGEKEQKKKKTKKEKSDDKKISSPEEPLHKKKKEKSNNKSEKDHESKLTQEKVADNNGKGKKEKKDGARWLLRDRR